MSLSDNEIKQIIDEFLNMTTERQYIGARYVPIFGRKNEDSILWDNTAPYEPLTIVLYQGNSYTSRQYVPIGIDITNEDFWANTGNYNAQVEQYRQEVVRIGNLLPDEEFSSVNTVKKYIDDINYSQTRSFETVEEMKLSNDLVPGLICHTLGFRTAGDDGAAWYIITDNGTANNMDVIACGDLFANLVITETYVTPEMFGAYGDGVNDDLEFINKAISTKLPIEGKNNYLVSDSIVLTNGTNNAYNAKRIAPLIKFDGKVECTHLDNAVFKITNAYNNLYCKQIVGAIGIELFTDTFQSWYNNIEFHSIEATNYGIYLHATSYGIPCNKFVGNIVRANEICIYLSTTNKFITENEFNITHVRALDSTPRGVKCEKTSSSTGEMNTNFFNNLSLEATTGIEHINAMAEYHSLRITELSLQTWCKLKGKSGIYIETKEIVEWGFADCSELESYGYYPCIVDCCKTAENRRNYVQNCKGLVNSIKSTNGFALVPYCDKFRYVTGKESFLCQVDGYSQKTDVITVFDIIGTSDVILNPQHYNFQGIQDVYFVAHASASFPFNFKTNVYDETAEDYTTYFSIPSAGTWHVTFLSGGSTLIRKYA